MLHVNSMTCQQYSSVQSSHCHSNAIFEAHAAVSNSIPVPLVYKFSLSPPTDLSHKHISSSAPVIGRTLNNFETGEPVALVIEDVTYKQNTYHTLAVIPNTIMFDFLQRLTFVSVGETWRGFPTALSDNKQVTISNHPVGINFASMLVTQPLTITLDPTGFFVKIIVNNSNVLYRLYCTESDYAQGIIANGTDTIIIKYDQSHRLATSSNGTDKNWAFVPLFNTTLEWTVDLSTIPCGLNATFYSAKEQVGNTYADACATNPSETEFDFMEANRESWHTTLHCKENDCGQAPPIGYGGTISDPRYMFQDAKGSVKNTYGAGTQYTINTLMPFQAKLIQTVNDQKQLIAVKLTLTQNGQSIFAKIDSSNEEYPGKLQAFGEELDNTTLTYGNTFYWSLWTGGLDWLEAPPCPQGASAPTSDTDQYKISAITVTTN